ncbi:MAG: chorismate mutase [Syntrophorhabdaceae bacterium]|nr:chorismate mutase [Syntrophorhabdaceae bacterium]
MSKRKLNALRIQIDKIDRKIIQLLKKRMEIAVKAKMCKEKILDAKREEEVINNVRILSESPLRPDFSESIYRLIIEESRNVQQQQNGGENI